MDFTKDYPRFQSYEQEEQEDWSGLPFPSSGALPDPGMESASPALAGRFFPTEPRGKLSTWRQAGLEGMHQA